MITHSFLTSASLGLVLLLLGISTLRAEITVRLSVKYILTPDGNRPDAGEIGTMSGFDAEITRANKVLAATGRGYQFRVDEYLDIRPPVPNGQPSDYWFAIDARHNRATIEAAAVAAQATWRWNTTVRGPATIDR